MAQFTTWLDGDEPPTGFRHAAPFNTGLPITHSTPEDIPTSVRHQILWANDAGVPIETLSAIYSLPEPWVELILTEERTPL